MRTAACHPDRKHCAKGLCLQCYDRQRPRKRLDPAKAAEARKRHVEKNPEAAREYHRRYDRESPARKRARANWRAAHPGYHHAYSIKSRYGVTKADYDRRLAEQGGGCAICGEPPKKKRLAIDHCHSTGKVRGLLCDPCNHGVGRFRDNPVLLVKAADYLRGSDS